MPLPDDQASLNEQILERLVQLNAQRAEEERNGQIRWLRPDYQAPEQTATQTQLAVIETATETVIEPADQQPWPAQPKAQLTAIRDLLRTNPNPWTIPQIAAHFKGKITRKRLGAIAENLERLEWFGFVISTHNSGVQSWLITEKTPVA